MVNNANFPFFPEPPREYNQQYLAQIVRAFSVFAQQQRSPTQLATKSSAASAATDGVLMWDGAGSYPLVSIDGEWRQIVVADGYAQLIHESDITAAAADTAYSITYDAPALADGVTRDGTNPERIVFADGGLYKLSFTAQISSASSSTVAFRFWPAVNGTAVDGSTIVAKLHQNDSSTVVSREALFQVSAADYLEVKWAVSSTLGRLKAEAATAYAPAAPSTTLTVSRIRA